ncbi:MAG: hypothetical protein AAB965_02090 [Patescibacteria group bacterium]
MQIQEFGEIDEYRSEWNPKNVSRCNPCHIQVNDGGWFQCTMCLVNLPWLGFKQVKKCLEELHVELWEIEYKKLLKVRALVRKGKVSELRLNRHFYHDINGILGVIVNERRFYELT